MAVIFNDTFTAGSDQLLDAHTPDTGTSWTKVWGTDAGAALEVKAATDTIAADTDVGGSNKGCIYSANATYPGADYYVESTYNDIPTQTTRPMYLLLRLTDQDNFYAVRITGTGGSNSQIYKKVAGTFTALGSLFATPDDGSVIKFQIIGNTLKVFDDGVEVQSVTDSAITATGKAGIAAGGGAELVTSSDDFNTVAPQATSFSVGGLNPPTIILNTADATDFAADTTPTLDFTGTDLDADSIEYNIQIDTVNTFESVNAGIIDSYSESNQQYNLQMYTGLNTALGQSFTGNGVALDRCKFYLKKSGSPTGNAVAKIYAHSGTFGTSSVPTGAALATSNTLDVSTLTTSYALKTFTFDGAFTPVNGTKYVVVIEWTGGDASNHIIVGGDSTSPSHGGNYSSFDGTWTGSNIIDLCFYVNSVGTPLLNKFSVTPDAGFVNPDTGGDTHPFNSGENIQFTVQAGDALAGGTWYWRTRAIDPSNSNTYSAWPAARSFTISAGTPTNSERSAVITGKSTSNAERGAVVTGKDSANAERAAILTGKATSNDERPSTMVGKDSATSERGAVLTGASEDSVNSERDAKIHGTDVATSERSTVITGKDSANSERPATLTGKEAASSERAGILTGTATTSAERPATITGKVTDSSERSASLIGSIPDERDAKIYAGFEHTVSDNFDTTDFKDAVNTTANWEGDGEISLE